MRSCCFLVALGWWAVGCGTPERAGTSYFDREIAPILQASCVGGLAPCHRDNGHGVALGNLDLSSFEAVQARRDVLLRQGAYPEPLLLMKAVSSQDLALPYRGEFYPLEILHGVGPTLTMGSDAYLTLKQWLDNGATASGRAPAADGVAGIGPCSQELSEDVDPDAVDADAPGLDTFEPINRYLVQSCGAGSCHGSAHADFYLTCGDSDAQRKSNYLMTRAFVTDPPDDSELLVRTLDPSSGGLWHVGGVFFASRDDADYVTVRDWAAAVGPLETPDASPARQFFEERVMPVLLARGCALQGCHGPMVTTRLRLRGGSSGFVSPIAMDRNYEQIIDKGLLAMGSPDPRVSRLLAKNLIGPHGGIEHRAGPIFETPGASADPADCPQPYDPDRATPLCTLAEWLRLERDELAPQYQNDLSAGTSVPLVYVERPPDAARFLDFWRYRPGADLVRAEATLGAGASLASATGRASLLGGCAGIGADRTGVDVRAPEVSHDGQRILFAMRIGAGDGLDIYEVGVDGSGCRQVTVDGGEVRNGILVQNFDPYYVVDELGVEWVVYASTRGGAEGPKRTPKHLTPSAHLWRQPLPGGTPEQMTFLHGVEAQPAMMADGQLIMTHEKVSPDLYQVSGKRINWDLSDYHPLLASRAQNFEGRGGYLPGQAPADAVLRPSFDYEQATEIREALDGNFLVVLADRDTYGEGGALGVFNRSIGPFEAGRDDPGFLRSLRVLPGPTGRAGEAAGAYRSPFPLPDGAILASYAPDADVGSAAPIAYDLVVVDRRTGQRRALVSSPASLVEAVLAYPRPPPPVFTVRQTGTGGVSADRGLIHFPDLPLLATLLDSNNRRGRDVAALRAATTMRVFGHGSPPPTCTAPDHPSCAADMEGPEHVYQARFELGETAVHPDGSVWVWLPTRQPFFFELLDADGQVLFRMREEFQIGPFENFGIGVPEGSFHSMCANCHGAVSGRDLDIAVSPDAVSAASATAARAGAPVELR
jgi:hypothetical protein